MGEIGSRLNRTRYFPALSDLWGRNFLPLETERPGFCRTLCTWCAFPGLGLHLSQARKYERREHYEMHHWFTVLHALVSFPSLPPSLTFQHPLVAAPPAGFIVAFSGKDQVECAYFFLTKTENITTLLNFVVCDCFEICLNCPHWVGILLARIANLPTLRLHCIVHILYLLQKSYLIKG